MELFCSLLPPGNSIDDVRTIREGETSQVRKLAEANAHWGTMGTGVAWKCAYLVVQEPLEVAGTPCGE